MIRIKDKQRFKDFLKTLGWLLVILYIVSTLATQPTTIDKMSESELQEIQNQAIEYAKGLEND